MAISVRQSSPSNNGVGTSVTATLPAPTQSGNGIVLLIEYGANNLSSVDDGGSNSYTQARLANSFGSNLSAIYYLSTQPGGVTTVTAHFSASTTVHSIVAVEVLGNLTAHTGNTRTANAGTQTPNSITTSTADTVVFVTVKTSNSPTLPSGFTSLSNDGVHRNSYQVFTSTQTGLAPSWTVGISSPFAACIEAFTSTLTGPPDVTASTSQGLSFGSSASPVVENAATGTAGFALGAAAAPEVSFEVTASAGLGLGAAAGVIPEIRVGFRLGAAPGSDIVLSDQFGLASEGIKLASRPRSDTGELANGRYRR